MIKLDIDRQTLLKLQQLTGTVRYEFLGFTLDLETGSITDTLAQSSKNLSEWGIQMLSTLLNHYSEASMSPLAGKLVKFKDLPGGRAYEEAFIKRAIQPIAENFGEKPQELPLAAEMLNGLHLGYGDASTEISALKGIPLTCFVYGAEDYPASANILYDESASKYLPTEDLAVLGELTTNRLIEAKKI